MSRIRSVHPGQPTDEQFVACSPYARLLCIFIRNEADDHGIFEWKPLQIKMRLFPADNVDVPALLVELTEHRHVARYQMQDKTFGIIRNFLKYQSPRRPSYVFPMPRRGDVPENFLIKDGECGIGGRSTDDIPDNDGNDAPEGIGEEGRGEDKKDSIDVEFAEFWLAVPRKIGRGQAEKAYARARKLAEPVLLLAAMRRFSAQSQGKDPEFVPHPATWLNGKRWLDEPSPRAAEDRGPSSVTIANAGKATDELYRRLGVE